MSKHIINHIGTYHDHSKSITINGADLDVAEIVRSFMSDDPARSKKEQANVEDITPVQEEKPEPVNSIVFTKKAKNEAKEADIIEALQKSVQGRKDKTRAFVEELQSWQKDGYVDAHYNAQVMYDELSRMIPLSFGYDAFKRHYNNTRK